jgi:lipid-A-disaccharide synthase
MPGVMISCGEPSGDLYAGALAAALRAQQPGLDIFGFGGPRLAAAGGTLLGSYEGLAVTGLSEVLRTLPKTWRMYRHLVDEAVRRAPDVFVAIDFADFNFRLAQALHARGIPVVYYIGPQLWAWRPARMQTIKRFATKVLVIFPFEQALYEAAGVPVEFVGHPLIDLIASRDSRAALLTRRSSTRVRCCGKTSPTCSSCWPVRPDCTTSSSTRCGGVICRSASMRATPTRCSPPATS